MVEIFERVSPTPPRTAPPSTLEQGLTKSSHALSRLSMGIIWEISSPLLSSQSVSCRYILYQLSYHSYYSIGYDSQQLFILFIYIIVYIFIYRVMYWLAYLYYLIVYSLPLSFLYTFIDPYHPLACLIQSYICLSFLILLRYSSPLLIYAYLCLSISIIFYLYIYSYFIS